MSNTNHTLIVMLLDASGSMESLKSGAVTGINAFIDDQKRLTQSPEDRPIDLSADMSGARPLSCNLTMIQFTSPDGYGHRVTADNGEPADHFHDHNVIHDNKSIFDVPAITEADYPTSGGTPLIDAYCKAIDDTNSAINKIAEPLRPGRVIFLVMTDGKENTSKKFKKADLTERLAKYQTEKNWQFIYLGANQDAIQEASSVGTVAANSMTYASTGVGLATAFASSSDLVRSKRRVEAREMTGVMYRASDYIAQDTMLGSAMNMSHVADLVAPSAVPTPPATPTPPTEEKKTQP